MKLKDILSKVIKGEALTDAEKAFLEAADPDKERDTAAAAARRQAEGERDDLKKRLEKLEADRAEEKRLADEKAAAGMTEAQKREQAFADLQRQVAELTKGKTEAEQRAAAAQRSTAIRDRAKAAGIVLAPKTVNEALFFQLLEQTLAGVDVSNETAVAAAMEKFKSENPGIIQAPGGGAGLKPGDPAAVQGSKNPWAKETFNLTEQMLIQQKDPAQAQALAQAAGVTL